MGINQGGTGTQGGANPDQPRDSRHRFVDTHQYDDAVFRLHAEGKGRNDIARELDIPHGRVSAIARKLELSFDGSRVLLATEVRRREAADRRSQLSLSLLDDAERLRDKMFSPITMISHGGKDFVKAEDELSEPIPQDQAHLARAITALLNQSVRLEEFDQRGSGLDQAISFLDNVMVTIRGGRPAITTGEDDDGSED